MLYTYILDITPSKKNYNKRDYFILSKGHASLAHAAILYEKNFIKLKGESGKSTILSWTNI